MEKEGVLVDKVIDALTKYDLTRVIAHLYRCNAIDTKTVEYIKAIRARGGKRSVYVYLKEEILRSKFGRKNEIIDQILHFMQDSYSQGAQAVTEFRRHVNGQDMSSDSDSDTGSHRVSPMELDEPYEQTLSQEYPNEDIDIDKHPTYHNEGGTSSSGYHSQTSTSLSRLSDATSLMQHCGHNTTASNSSQTSTNRRNMSVNLHQHNTYCYNICFPNPQAPALLANQSNHLSSTLTPSSPRIPSRYSNSEASCYSQAQPIYIKTLDDCHSDFEQLVNVYTLLPLLRTAGLLTEEEEQNLELQTLTTSKKARSLFQMLKRKGESGFSRFMKVLSEEHQHQGHKDLESILSKQYAANMPKAILV